MTHLDMTDWLRANAFRRVTDIGCCRPAGSYEDRLALVTLRIRDEERFTYDGRGPTIDDAFADALRHLNTDAERARLEQEEIDAREEERRSA